MNPRFTAYAKAHGKTPEAMLAHQEETGARGEFSLWIQQKWQQFTATQGPRPRGMSQAEWIAELVAVKADEFDAWLVKP